MKTRCLLVDDEPLALEVLETYLASMEDMEIVGQCPNALRAMEILQHKPVDLMFLDIRMPQLSGISFLKTLQKAPKVIITTAYRDYALEGYDLNVVDYLLKPISLERFVKAVNKYYEMRKDPAAEIQQSTERSRHDGEFIYVRSDKKSLKVMLRDILYIESMKDYVIVHKRDRKIISKDLISRFEDILPEDLFIRIHRSYIVSIPRIEAITASTIEIAKRELPIGRSYRNIVLRTLNYSERGRVPVETH
jgi:DNA-binding LytR/AlgR family response regulator